jgi:hypothetical protein
MIGLNPHLDHLSDFVNEILLEAGDGLPFPIGEEKNEVLKE